MIDNKRWKNQSCLWKEFIPLSLSDIVMTLGDPLVSTTLAHLPNSQINIGSFGIAKSMAVVFESPIIMILHASNVLCKNKDSRRVLWQFTLLLSGFMSICLLFLSLPSIFSYVAHFVLGIDGKLEASSQRILAIVALWPFAIGWRRFFQGMLIQAGYAKQVGRSSLGRLAIVALILFVGWNQKLSGDLIAAAALVGGILAEAIFVTIVSVRERVTEKIVLNQQLVGPKTLSSVWKFYWPLANSSLIVWGGRALLLAIIARSIDGPIALASWTAGWGMVLVVGNATRMVQQVIIRKRELISDRELLLFACSVGVVCTLILVAISMTSLGVSILEAFFGNDQELVTRVMPVLVICSCIPMGMSIQNAIQGFLISDGRTKQVNFATWIGFLVTLAMASILVSLGKPGAASAALSMLCAIFMEVLYLALTSSPEPSRSRWGIPLSDLRRS